MPVMITLNKICEASLRVDDLEKALKAHGHLRMNTEFPLSSILDSNDLEDTLWCFRALPEHIEIPRRFAIWCAREVQHLVEDEDSVDAINVAERYLDGNATLEELEAAYVTAAAINDNASFAATAATAAASYAAYAATYAATAAVAAAFCAHYAANATTDVDMEQKQIDKLREMLG